LICKQIGSFDFFGCQCPAWVAARLGALAASRGDGIVALLLVRRDRWTSDIMDDTLVPTHIRR
jgi:hypothetical protein